MTFCQSCGTQLPDGAAFCYKCGASVSPGAGAPTKGSISTQQRSGQVLAPVGATALKCPSCGAPISPRLGEMVITCEYCGTGVALESDGWKDIQKHTMLPMLVTKDKVDTKIQEMMDKGIFRHHLHEESALEEMTATFVPYWIIPVSARTTVVSMDTMAEMGQIATTAALIGVMSGMGGGGYRRRSIELSALLGQSLFGGVGRWRGALGLSRGFMFYGMGMGMGGTPKKTYQLDQNYNFPVVAMKDLSEYQPHDFTFDLSQRVLFDISKIDKSIRVLNGDIGEDVAQAQAKTLVDGLQAKKAHAQYHMIQEMHTDMDAAEGELLHVPVWFSRYDHKGKKIVFVIDGNSGAPINSIGL